MLLLLGVATGVLTVGIAAGARTGSASLGEPARRTVASGSRAVTRTEANGSAGRASSPCGRRHRSRRPRCSTSATSGPAEADRRLTEFLRLNGGP